MKRKIRQIQHTIEGTYAVADDGTWWRIIDPMSTNWVQLPNLPDASDSLFGATHEHPTKNIELYAKDEEIVQLKAEIQRLKGDEGPRSEEHKPVARLKVKP